MHEDANAVDSSHSIRETIQSRDTLINKARISKYLQYIGWKYGNEK